MLSHANIPILLKQKHHCCQLIYIKKFKATDAKALTSIQAIAALNIHLGGDRDISKKALTEFLRNLTSFEQRK